MFFCGLLNFETVVDVELLQLTILHNSIKQRSSIKKTVHNLLKSKSKLKVKMNKSFGTTGQIQPLVARKRKFSEVNIDEHDEWPFLWTKRRILNNRSIMRDVQFHDYRFWRNLADKAMAEGRDDKFYRRKMDKAFDREMRIIDKRLKAEIAAQIAAEDAAEALSKIDDDDDAWLYE